MDNDQRNDTGNRTVYAGNIPWTVDDAALWEAFEVYGAIERAYVIRDEANAGRSQGYGFVRFVDPACALRAIEETDGGQWNGRTIRVAIADSAR